jgi:uncharacterized membrane protein
MRLIQANICLYFFLLILGISGFFFAVIWPHSLGFYAFIAFAALGGLGVACYIYYTKRYHKQLVCPIGSDCNAVVTSRYSKFLGVPLEHWGILYYAIIVSAYAVLIFAPHLLSGVLLSGLIILTAAAFLFSLYLLFVQAFLLRQWCIWCLLSAMLSIMIFIVSLASVDFAMAFLNEITGVIELMRALGFVLGMGGATTAMLLFARFLRDLDIDENELQTLKGLSELVWLGLAFTLVGQFTSYVIDVEMLSQSGLFLTQTIALFVVAISGAVLMIIFAPLLAIMPFTEPPRGHHHSPLESLRKPLFITGSVALSSWYFAFVMNYLPEYRLAVLFFVYLAVIAVSTATALFLEKKISAAPLKKGQ